MGVVWACESCGEQGQEEHLREVLAAPSASADIDTNSASAFCTLCQKMTTFHRYIMDEAPTGVTLPPRVATDPAAKNEQGHLREKAKSTPQRPRRSSVSAGAAVIAIVAAIAVGLIYRRIHT